MSFCLLDAGHLNHIDWTPLLWYAPPIPLMGLPSYCILPCLPHLVVVPCVDIIMLRKKILEKKTIVKA